MSFNTDLKIGVLGGGQLGRMLIQSAININIDLRMMDLDPNAPCAKLVADFTVGDLEDFNAVYEFGKQCDILTIEIEKVNIEAMKKLQSEGVKVYPQPEIIEMIQDKRVQKQFYQDNNIPTAPFVLTENRADLEKLSDKFPAVHKIGKGGYDGRGVQVVKTKEDINKGFDAPSLLEDFVPFKKELAVIVSRNEDGEVNTFPVVEMVFHPEHNLVEYLLSPAIIEKSEEQKAKEVAIDIIQKLEMVGILAVEMFLTKDNEIMVNEIAPRPHNSGHQSIEGNFVSQYDQHLRAILNLPLGNTSTKISSAMVNILGEDGFTGDAKYEGMEEVMKISGASVHLYGKKLTKPFRKMGHVTITDPSLTSLKRKIEKVKSTLKVKA
ncbi:N5-carboxyaminoimidazole ribonucleotide synthase [Marivirga tractuosa]|uniref:N5-carboxyaminoimidazole ribonucleotide synthase n=1 Tax=Marivirga tractuosa (strain ATCC 23168 / DSM 4126 / NBRC 15989 / NCIMB 1408 / VKM B-1430 / H-43) TaxID=643867 RepID=E4TPJ5_MARTH|nr:5-(carboxyamino)imidazole ribonucleotide synthase [Marivirga tractuosa]ADR22559.1 5-(carboxyamino)imidazole ribonucleotide synthase [Marivirga tractuosa DSM 4126]BDD16770.1 N5-carboxyaminoimidazole ribonucleotide synthase [Marivirga tractuosa]